MSADMDINMDRDEELYYQLHDLSQKKLLSMSESHKDQGVRKVVLINNLFRVPPPFLEKTHISHEPLELEEQTWFDSCLNDLYEEEEEEADLDNSDEEMEWSFSSSNMSDELSIDFDNSLIQTQPYFMEMNVSDSPPNYLPIESQPSQIQLTTIPSVGQDYLPEYYFQDKPAALSNPIPGNTKWSDNQQRLSWGCYANHRLY